MSLSLSRGLPLKSKILGGPSAVLPTTNLLLQLDHSTAVYQDVAGTTPATVNGDIVRRWDDGRGNQNATNSGALGTVPVLRTGANGINNTRAVYFDGSDTLDVTGLSNASGPVSVYAVVDSNVGVLDTFKYLFDIQTGRTIIALAGSGGDVGWYDGVTWRSIADPVTGVQMLTWVLQSSDGEVWRSRTSLGTAAFIERAVGGSVGVASNFSGGASWADVEIGALYVYTAAHGAAQREAVWDYLEQEFNV